MEIVKAFSDLQERKQDFFTVVFRSIEGLVPSCLDNQFTIGYTRYVVYVIYTSSPS